MNLINKKISEEIGKETNGENNNILEYIAAQIFISAISFELIIKLFYLLEKNEVHEKTHDIEKLFDKLNAESQKLIEEEFNKTVIKPSKEFKIGDKIYIPNFREALSQNKEIITNFKYKPMLRNGSILNEIFIKKLFIEIKSRINSKNNN